MAEVVLDHLSKVYANGFQAVSDLSLSVADGEFLVLVGPSGCGKTTALRMVAGLEDISEGTLRIGERVVNDVSPNDRDIAMVFQSYALYPHLTVGENIAYGMRMRQVPKGEIRERVGRATSMLGLDDQVDRKPGQLSGGQRQRVAMGRAIVRDPQVFLMDEPLSNLDAKLRVQMRADIASLQRDLGTTTLYVTHDQVEAMTMGDRVAVIRSAVLQQCDTPQSPYDDPDNLFVAGFIGSPPMNMAMGRVGERAGGLTVRLGEQELAVPDVRVRERAGLRAYVGRDIAVGVRSEDMEDAQLARDPEGQRLRARVLLTGALGSEILVRIGLAAEVVRTADVEALAKDTGAADVAALLPTHAGSVPWLASCLPRSQVRPGDDVEVVVDTGRMHFFDPGTGAAVRG